MCVQRALTLLFATFANLHVRKLAMFADLHSYTHTYCSFILLNEAITICCFCFAPCTCVINLAFGFFSIQFTSKNIQQVENSTSKMAPPIPVCPKIMWHTGDLYLANKELRVRSALSLMAAVKGPGSSNV